MSMNVLTDTFPYLPPSIHGNSQLEALVGIRLRTGCRHSRETRCTLKVSITDRLGYGND